MMGETPGGASLRSEGGSGEESMSLWMDGCCTISSTILYEPSAIACISALPGERGQVTGDDT